MDSTHPNPILGVLGGGQLGRMLIQSAINYNQDIHVLDPDPKAPCKDIAQKFVVGSLKDYAAVYAFGKDCDVITVEIEAVNTEALQQLADEGKKVFPQPHLLALIQDKRTQKQFYLKHGIPTAEFILTEMPLSFPLSTSWGKKATTAEGCRCFVAKQT